MIYWLFFFRKLANYDVEQESRRSVSPDAENLTIIICAKNEAQNLQQNLPRILNQTDRSHNILVINDNSHDNSLYVLEKFKKKFSIFDIINLTNTNKSYLGKKHALSVGLKNADHKVVLLTDADCQPVSENWVSRMRQGLGDGEVGLAYSPYAKYPGFLNLFIRYEAVWTAVQYLSFALRGLPYMGVGRNLIYKKELFTRTDGFDKHGHIASGDDDLFINEVAFKENTRVILHPETFILSEPKTDWRSYVRQKRRHLSTGGSYRLQHKVLLGLLSASHFLFYTFGIASAFYNVTIFFTLFVVRLVVMLGIYKGILKRLGEPKMLLWIPLLDAVYVLFYLYFATALMNTNTKWK